MLCLHHIQCCYSFFTHFLHHMPYYSHCFCIVGKYYCIWTFIWNLGVCSQYYLVSVSSCYILTYILESWEFVVSAFVSLLAWSLKGVLGSIIHASCFKGTENLAYEYFHMPCTSVADYATTKWNFDCWYINFSIEWRYHRIFVADASSYNIINFPPGEVKKAISMVVVS